MAVHHAAQHHILGQLVRFRLDHQHRTLGAGDDQIQLRRLQLRRGRIDHVLAIDIADARRADRPFERHSGQRHRRGSADQRRDVGIDFGIDRQDMNDDLYFVIEAIRKQWTQRPVDQPRCQRLLFRRAPFALEEPARNATRRIRFLYVVHRQRKEILARLRYFARHDSCQHDRIAHRAQHGTVGLPCHLAGFQSHGMRAV